MLIIIFLNNSCVYIEAAITGSCSLLGITNNYATS